MATSGAQPGNKNAVKGKRFNAALDEAFKLMATDREAGWNGLVEVAKAVITKALEGDISAAREIADRYDGKPAQAITGADGGDLVLFLSEIAKSSIKPQREIED